MSCLLSYRWSIALPLTILFLGAGESRGQADSNEIAHVAQSVGSSLPTWRDDVRRFLTGESSPTFGSREAVAARATRLIGAVHDYCRLDGCRTASGRGQGAVFEVAHLARRIVCGAYPVAMTIPSGWAVPSGVAAFDFQPRGMRPTAGATPIVPGDERLTGGRSGRYVNDAQIVGDSMIDVRAFRAQVPRGEMRIIILGASRRVGTDHPFGREVRVNGRSIDILTSTRWLETAAAGPTGANHAPAIILDGHAMGDLLVLEFPDGAEIGGILVEPAGQPSALPIGAALSGAVQSNAGCLDGLELLDRALVALTLGPRLWARERMAIPPLPARRPPAPLSPN